MDYYLIDNRTVLAEEFVRGADFSTTGLRSSDAGLSLLIRSDSSVSAVAVTREQAGEAPPLRDHEEFPRAPMLTVTPAEPLPGFREKRFYRILFARKPTGHDGAGGELDDGGDRYNWQLLPVAGGIAWCLDLTAHLNDGGALGPLLTRLSDEMRLRHGLIPVATERFQ